MRIVAGRWRGRTLVAPPGQVTRPTADRVRQALFDMLLHASWGGRAVFTNAAVLDVFAGTGALGLEALSRGAARACFIENDAVALRALQANIAVCNASAETVIVAGDALRVTPARITLARRRSKAVPEDTLPFQAEHQEGNVAWPGRPAQRTGPAGAPMLTASESDAQASLVFLDPPYSQQLVPRALQSLGMAGWIAPGALIIAEIGRDENWVPEQPVLVERQHGAARILVFRMLD